MILTPWIEAKLKIKNKLMRHRCVEEANQLATWIGLDIVKRISTGWNISTRRQTLKICGGPCKDWTTEIMLKSSLPGSMLKSWTSTTPQHIPKNLWKQPSEYRCSIHGDGGVQQAWQAQSYSHRTRRLPGRVSQTRSCILFQANHETFKQIHNIKLGTDSMEVCLHMARPIQKVETSMGPSDFCPISITPVQSRLLKNMVVKTYF